MPLNDVVTINVSLSGAGITRAGFGTDLILSNTGNAWSSPELTRTYTSLLAVAADFATTTPEYLAAAALFAQPIKPAKILIGKAPTKPTQIKKLSSITAVNTQVYKVNVFNDGVLWSASYTSDNTATVAEIVAGLVAQLTPSAWQSTHAYVAGDRVTNDTGKIFQCTVGGTSAGSGGPTGTGAAIVDGTVTWQYISTPNFTAVATDTNSTITCTANSAGKWFALEPIASGDPLAVSNLMAVADNTTDPGVSTDLTAILGADQTWYALTLLFKSKAIVATAGTGVSAWCESNSRLLLACFEETASATSAYSGATDALAALTAAAATYTAGMFHPRPYEFLDAATDGYFLPLNPGSDNWRLKTLSGPTPCNVTPTQQTNLKNRRAGYYYQNGGVNVIGGLGQVESPVYAFIDTRRNIDWYAVNLQADLYNLFLVNNKIAHTNAGLELIAATIDARNQLGITAGVISPDVAPTTVVPDSQAAGTFDPTTRALTGVSASFKLASPMNSITVQVNITQ